MICNLNLRWKGFSTTMVNIGIMMRMWIIVANIYIISAEEYRRQGTAMLEFPHDIPLTANLIVLTDVQLGSLLPVTFTSFSQLEQLTISSDELANLSETAFTGLQLLHTLILTNDHIAVIPPFCNKLPITSLCWTLLTICSLPYLSLCLKIVPN